LTYHLGGLYHLCTPGDEQHAHKKLAESLHIARIFGAEDVSMHPPMLANIPLTPPYLPTDSPNHREQSKERFHTLLGTWLPRFQEHGITLSLETHVTSSYFLFTGLQDFRDFSFSIPGLGVLIDVAHNYYDGYEIPELLAFAESLPVTGLHLSDSIRGVDVSRGTHLPIGKGHIDFTPLVTHFAANHHLYAALEVRGPSQGISDSIAHLSGLF
jgi:sugar phosphate isomerase/epimerase